jgi:hypothetical protein
VRRRGPEPATGGGQTPPHIPPARASTKSLSVVARASQIRSDRTGRSASGLRHRQRTDGPRTPTDLREDPQTRNDVQDADESLASWTRHRVGVRQRHRRRITGAPARFATTIGRCRCNESLDCRRDSATTLTRRSGRAASPWHARLMKTPPPRAGCLPRRGLDCLVTTSQMRYAHYSTGHADRSIAAGRYGRAGGGRGNRWAPALTTSGAGPAIL